jgi:outer membrane protein assembly factor BamA
MNSFNISYGYTWKESAQKEYEITPIAINFAKLMKTTPAFEALLNENRYLRKSFEQQFTIGSIYSFTYNTLIGKPKKNQYYFNATLDLSGNTIYFLQSALKSKKTVNNEYSIGGYMYSQYSKLTTDTRYYLSLNKKSKLATRLIIGAGIPYMNSTTLPYVKQFFSGGANSIRGFLPRTVGPGMYETIVNDNSKLLIDKAGDIKLEANIEYRFDIVSVLKGALFTDAGNIWLVNKNDELPGGEFKINTFQQQIAVSAGFGLRIDISFFVIRFDLAAPLRKPYLPENEQWVINKINFGSSGWRKDNLVLNIAIGYPF